MVKGEKSNTLHWMIIVVLLALMVAAPVYVDMTRWSQDRNIPGPEALQRHSSLLTPICWIEMGELAEAEAVLNSGLQVDPANGEAWCVLGLCHERQGRVDEAIEDFQRSLDLIPEAVFRDLARMSLARLLNANGRTAEAGTQVRLHLLEKPDSRIGLRMGVTVAKAGGDTGAEQEYLKRLISSEAGSAAERAQWNQRLLEIAQ